MGRRLPLLAVLLTAGLLIASCGESSSQAVPTDEVQTNQPSTAAGAPAETVVTPTTAAAPASQVALDDAPVVAGTEAGKPAITINDPSEPEGLVTTDIIVGEGTTAEVGNLVELHYVGTLMDGTEFDTSWDREDTFLVSVGTGGVIPGFDQGIVGAAEGGRRVVVIPPHLAYGSTGAGDVIPPDATIAFVLDIVRVLDLQQPEAPTDVAAPDGLEITDITVGEGPVVESGDTITVHYHGSLLDGTVFDSSWNRGSPFTTPIGIGRVIPGWDEGMVGMQVGGRRMLVIPSDLAYGEQGSGANIGPNEPLVFIVDLVKIG